MKKQSVKKLVLAKETVRKLEDGRLVKAAGGMTVHSCGYEASICVPVEETHTC